MAQGINGDKEAQMAQTAAAMRTALDNADKAERPSRFRWVVCGLLLAAIIVNYVDRQMIGVLKPDYLQKEFNWSETDYAHIVMAFQAAYALAYLFWGRIMDKIGAKAGLASAFLLWTIAHMMHGAARSLMQFALVRVLLGIGESGGLPGSIKAVTEYFPKRERALATGIFNAGTNFGAILTPLIVPFIVVDLNMGWRASFYIIGAASLIWLPIWWILYKNPAENPAVNAAELAIIQSDPADEESENPSWLQIISKKEAWAYAFGRFMIDPVWWMFLFWLPDFLSKTYHLDIKSFGPPLVAIYLISDVGSVTGGWLSSKFMQMGWSINKARKTAMLIFALMALPVWFAAKADNMWFAVIVIGIVTAAHQGFSCNLFTLPSDIFPRKATGTVVGFGGMAGGVGGLLFSNFVGKQLEALGGYAAIFAVAGSAYLIALLVIHLITPRYETAKFNK